MTVLGTFLVGSIISTHEGLFPKDEPSNFKTFASRGKWKFASRAWKSTNLKSQFLSNLVDKMPDGVPPPPRGIELNIELINLFGGFNYDQWNDLQMHLHIRN